jgi:4-amino-4-deoxy-L-arabinose transferase-like glycosyltransferase
LPIAALAIALAFTLVHGSRVRDNLAVAHWEDMDFIRHNASNVHSLQDCFTERPLWPGLYRPLTTNLYYYAGRVLFANRIEVHHGINIALYLINAFLVYLICLRLLPGWWALVPPVLFASRFSHVEVVLNTCEVQTLLSVFFTLLALKLFMSARPGERGYYYVLSLIAFGLALLSKETALVFPAILLAYGILYDEKRAWRHYIPPAGLAIIWAVLYITVFRAVTDHEPTGFTYRSGAGHLLTNYAAYLLTFVNLLTHRLGNMAMVQPVSRVAGTAAVRFFFAACVIACAAYYIFRARAGRYPRGRYGAMVFGFAFFLIALCPYAILESRLFMRYGYAGHAGVAISVGALLYYIVTAIRERSRKEAEGAGARES